MASFTRKAIIDSYARQLLTKPVDKITVKDIVEDCGISRNTFYYHFKDIYEVLEEILHMQEQKVIRAIESGEIEAEDWKRGMEQVVENRDVFYRLYRSARAEQVRRYFSDSAALIFNHVVEVKARGIDADEGDKELISRFYRHAFEGCLNDWLESGMKSPLDQEMERMELATPTATALWRERIGVYRDFYRRLAEQLSASLGFEEAMPEAAPPEVDGRLLGPSGHF